MLAAFETRIFELIDDLVENGTDDELFASGYLQGHLTVAVAEAEMADQHSLDQLSLRVQDSLDKAIAAGELSPADQVLVRNLWLRLYQQAVQ